MVVRRHSAAWYSMHLYLYLYLHLYLYLYLHLYICFWYEIIQPVQPSCLLFLIQRGGGTSLASLISLVTIECLIVLITNVDSSFWKYCKSSHHDDNFDIMIPGKYQIYYWIMDGPVHNGASNEIKEIMVCRKCPKVKPYCEPIFVPIMFKPFLDGA